MDKKILVLKARGPDKGKEVYSGHDREEAKRHMLNRTGPFDYYEISGRDGCFELKYLSKTNFSEMIIPHNLFCKIPLHIRLSEILKNLSY